MKQNKYIAIWVAIVMHMIQFDYVLCAKIKSHSLNFLLLSSIIMTLFKATRPHGCVQQYLMLLLTSTMDIQYECLKRFVQIILLLFSQYMTVDMISDMFGSDQ